MATKPADVKSDSSETLGSPGTPPSSPSVSLFSDSEEAPGSHSLLPCSERIAAKPQRRKHTQEQKRSMLRERKKRKRRLRSAIKKAKEVQMQNEAAKGQSRDVMLYKQMAHHRWQWELKRRKEAARTKREQIYTGLHEIDPAYLMDPKKDGQTTVVHLGLGSFSIVQLKVISCSHRKG